MRVQNFVTWRAGSHPSPKVFKLIIDFLKDELNLQVMICGLPATGKLGTSNA